MLSAVAEKLAAGDRQLDEIIAIAEQELNEKGFRADDIQIRDADTLLELTDASQRAVILMAARAGAGPPDRQPDRHARSVDSG